MAEYKIQDTTLNAIANAINAKTGGTSAMTPAQMVAAIGTISGGGSSGYAKKSGSFILTSDYTYDARPYATYTGSILINTGLTKIEALVIWSEEWASGEVESNCFGLSAAFPDMPPTNDSVYNVGYYYASYSTMRNGTNNIYGSDGQGIIFNSLSNNIPEGSFGLRCHSANFPIRAGHTIKWEAWGKGTGGGGGSELPETVMGASIPLGD